MAGDGAPAPGAGAIVAVTMFLTSEGGPQRDDMLVATGRHDRETVSMCVERCV